MEIIYESKIDKSDKERQILLDRKFSLIIPPGTDYVCMGEPTPLNVIPVYWQIRENEKSPKECLSEQFLPLGLKEIVIREVDKLKNEKP